MTPASKSEYGKAGILSTMALRRRTLTPDGAVMKGEQV